MVGNTAGSNATGIEQSMAHHAASFCTGVHNHCAKTEK